MNIPDSENIEEIRVTPEGWVYLIVLAFISVGAVLRNVNLLILMAGMMCAPLLINWRIAVHWLKTLSATRMLPHRLHAGKLSSLQWICQNDGNLPAWYLEVHETIKSAHDLSLEPAKLDTGWISDVLVRTANRFFGRRTGSMRSSNAVLSWFKIAPHRNATAVTRMVFAERGKYTAGPAVLSSRFPFGLISFRILIPEKETFYVAPALGILTPTWDRRVESSVAGSDAIKRKRSHEEDEFYALRPWRSGDSRKHIHWRTTARIGQPIVKQHEQQDNRDFAMLLDLHRSPVSYPTSNTWDPNCELLLSFAATVVLHLKKAVQGRIAVAICGSETTICLSRNHRELFDQSMKMMALASAGEHPAIADSLLEVFGSVTVGTPIYVVSTRTEPTLIDASAPIRHQLKSVVPFVKWITVGSPEFNDMFRPDSNTDHSQIDVLTEKWRIHPDR